MPKTSVQLHDGGGQVGKISFEIQNIYAQGGPEFPRLTFLLDLHFSPLVPFGQSENLVHPLTWLFVSGQLCSPEQRVVADFRDEVNFYVSGAHPVERQLRLEIPLDFVAVERIEQERTADIRMALKFRALFAVHAPDGTSVRKFDAARIDDVAFTIPQSEWVGRLLPGLGHGKLELIEVRIASGLRAEGLPKAVEEFLEARSYLANGDWEKAVTHCRNTLESVLSSRTLSVPATSRFGQKVDTFIGEVLGSGLGEKQAKLLADEMKSLWDVCSVTAHPNPPGYFKRADANFIVQNTGGILEYIGAILA